MDEYLRKKYLEPAQEPLSDVVVKKRKRSKKSKKERKVNNLIIHDDYLDGQLNPSLEDDEAMENAVEASPGRSRRRMDSDDEDRDASPVRRRRDEDLSPPRRRFDSDDEGTGSPSARAHGGDNDTDLSPPRKSHRGQSDDDLSPVRKRRIDSDEDGDMSPPRRGEASKQKQEKENRNEEPKKISGLASGKDIATMIAQKKKKEEEAIARMSKEEQGVGQKTVYRDKKGQIVDTDAAMAKLKEKQEKEKAEKFEWGTGRVQMEEARKKWQEDAMNRNKPLNIYADDKELDNISRATDRWGDPMSRLIKTQKEAKKKLERPVYKGPAAPPNRFNIPPGHRWDGVNRSNGFEKWFFELQATKGRQNDMAYQWGVEDM